VSDADVLARLRPLSDEAFGRFAAAVAETLAPDATVTLAPPSPAGGVDAVIESERDDRRRLVHVRRQTDSGHSPVSVVDETDTPERVGETEPGAAFDVADLREVLAGAESFDAVVVVVVGRVTAEASRAAAAAGVRLLDGDALSSYVRERGVDLPRPESVAERFDRLVERQTSEWPPTLRDLASRVLAEIESVAAFDHRIVHAGEATDVDFLFARRSESQHGEGPARATGSAPTIPVDPVVRARLTETEFRVCVVDADGQFACVATLSATREDEPTLSAILGDVRPAVERAVERHE
jgi:hypothetical protein